jgi:hypothetical protein
VFVFVCVYLSQCACVQLTPNRYQTFIRNLIQTTHLCAQKPEIGVQRVLVFLLCALRCVCFCAVCLCVCAAVCVCVCLRVCAVAVWIGFGGTCPEDKGFIIVILWKGLRLLVE